VVPVVQGVVVVLAATIAAPAADATAVPRDARETATAEAAAMDMVQV
jgi:hypothetical protein